LGLQAISFDFWGTLFTEQPGGFELYKQRRLLRLEEALRACGDFTTERIERACHLEAEAHHAVWTKEHRTLSAAERVGRVLTHLEACLPDREMAELIRAYEEGILEHPPVLVCGAREIVERLAGRYRLGIISDVGFSPGRVLKQVLEQNDMLHLFDSMVFSDEAGRSKPHREVFERTAISLRAEPFEIIHIGDLERTDIIGAKRAGFRAVRFTGVTIMGEGETTIADFVMEDYTELPKIIKSIEGEHETTELAGSREVG
jgi:HAD superfamily hydrolase (TIGR01549 family)